MTTPGSNFIGINVSGTQARAALVDHDGALIDTKVAQFAPKELISQLAAMVEDLGSRGPVASIGVAIPGLVNRQTDRVIAPRDLPATITGDLHGELMRATGIRCPMTSATTPNVWTRASRACASPTVRRLVMRKSIPKSKPR